MSKKEKLETDYQNFNLNIERIAEEEIKKIREKANAIKEEASKTGEAVELSLNKEGTKAAKKKG
jgi:outer membrane murein-binding lipoprotein Lpp